MGQKKSKFVELTDPRATWQIVSDLGSGAYGKVHHVQRKSDKADAAAKVAKIETKGELLNFNNEINILASCEHKNITNFKSAYYHDQQLWIVIEKCDGGSVADLMNKVGHGFSEDQVQTAANQMLDALNYIHAKNIYHRDINAANTLISSEGLVKLADFGISVISAKRRNTFIGSPMWMAPEVIACEKKQSESYTTKCDIWSLGITLIEFAESKPPYHDLHPMKAMMKIATGGSPKLKEPEKWSALFPEFLSSVLIKDPNNRESAGSLLEHVFVAGQNEPSRLIALFQENS